MTDKFKHHLNLPATFETIVANLSLFLCFHDMYKCFTTRNNITGLIFGHDDGQECANKDVNFVLRQRLFTRLEGIAY